MEKSKLGEMLIEARMIDEHQLSVALSDQRYWGGRLGEILVDRGFVEEAQILRLLSDQLNLPVIRLDAKPIDPEVLELLSDEEAKKYSCLPLFVREEGAGQVLYLAMDEPTNLEYLDNLGFRTGLKLNPVLAGSRELKLAIQKYYGGQDEESPPKTQGLAEKDAIDLEPHRPLEAQAPMKEQVVGSIDSAPSYSESSLEKPAPPAQESPSVSTGAASPEIVCKAMASLLIEKGLVSSEELMGRMEQLWEESLEKQGH